MDGRIEKIKLSFSCNEKLSKMRPCAEGLHCPTCNKTVVDFRQKTLAELTRQLEENESVCGIFSTDQMLKKRKTFQFGRLVASIFIALGLGTINKSVFGQTGAGDTLSAYQEQNKDENNFIGGIVETPAIFKYGGDKQLSDFLSKNINWPKNGRRGYVELFFAIDTAGRPGQVKIIKSLGTAADKEAIRLVMLLEFTPSTKYGRKVKEYRRLSIPFNMRGKKYIL